ncbi:hypothetical protein, partial [Corallococcus exiguus]|uniref:hypothetical protein n=1 Tax=Corallococcus exiguus TaxID=83462 RepID=UPI00155FAF7B
VEMMPKNSLLIPARRHKILLHQKIAKVQILKRRRALKKRMNKMKLRLLHPEMILMKEKSRMTKVTTVVGEAMKRMRAQIPRQTPQEPLRRTIVGLGQREDAETMKTPQTPMMVPWTLTKQN